MGKAQNSAEILHLLEVGVVARYLLFFVAA